jgi:hypothetical protein
VLRTAKTNLALAFLPAPLLAALVSLAWAGLWVWRQPGVERVALTVSIYFSTFLVFGRPDNFYWGLMIAPILPLGLVGWAVAWQEQS